MKTNIWMMATMLGLTLALAGCPKDETDSGPGVVDSGPGVVDSGPGVTDSGPGTDSAVVACMMTGNDCAAWCTAYLANCSTDDTFLGFADMAACDTACGMLNMTQTDCRAYHACFAGTFAAGSGDRDMHCDHAAGMTPCM